MEAAIDNMIDEIKKPVDPEINGSARKAELLFRIVTGKPHVFRGFLSYVCAKHIVL